MTAMKTQGGGSVKTESDTELEMAGKFLQKGFTDAQAKLMAVWQNPNISSICSQMPNMTILMSNAAAAMGKTQLSADDRNLLQRYARETYSDYCTGCTTICESAISGNVPVGNIMRYLMYSRQYGEHDHACERFRNIAPAIRQEMNELDYSLAEQRCPQKMQIGRLMREASKELS
jgi:hypothetical protein